MTVVDPADRELARSALDKRRNGKRPTREEERALRRIEAAQAEAARAEAFGSITKKEWQAWSGRQQKILNEQAARYGIPIGQAIIRLPEVVLWLHDFLAENAAKLAAHEEADTSERDLLQERAALARLKRQEKEGQLVALPVVQETMARWAQRLRQAAELLGRRHGAEAQAILDDALDDCGRLLAADLPDDSN